MGWSPTEQIIGWSPYKTDPGTEKGRILINGEHQEEEVKDERL